MLSLSVEEVTESKIWLINNRENGSSPFQKDASSISLGTGWGANFVLILHFKVVFHVNVHSCIYTVYYHLQSGFAATISFDAVLVVLYLCFMDSFTERNSY